MPRYEYSGGYGEKIYVEVLGIDKETRKMTLQVDKLLTVGVGKNAETSLVASHVWRRAERGSKEPVWEVRATDGSWHFVDKHDVDTEARMTWVRHNVPIEKSKRVVKVKQNLVDVTNYGAWREKLRAAREMLN
jgi:hypothetical protein